MNKPVEILVPKDWDYLRMDSSKIKDKGYVDEVIADMKDSGLRVLKMGSGEIFAAKRSVPRDDMDKLVDEQFRMGIAPSLLYDGFTDIRFERKNSEPGEARFPFQTIQGGIVARRDQGFCGKNS